MNQTQQENDTAKERRLQAVLPLDLGLRCMKSHYGKIVKALLDERKITYLYLPPYSPDLNPIEKLWSKLKSILRKLKVRAFEKLPDSEVSQNVVAVQRGPQLQEALSQSRPGLSVRTVSALPQAVLWQPERRLRSIFQ